MCRYVLIAAKKVAMSTIYATNAYCNASCKKKHRHKHKKDCEQHIRLAAKHAAKHAAELHDIELFKQPPSDEDCPICFLRLSSLGTGRRYQTCCGKVICSGCIYAPVYDNQGNKVDNEKQNQCPFCRTVAPKSSEEAVKRLNKLVAAGDPIAMYNLGCYYRDGCGLPQDYAKALELWHRAGELGYAIAYASAGELGYAVSAYYDGRGVEVYKKKANHYYELAAMGGNANARYNLGNLEGRAGNMDRALKHYLIAVSSGDAESLKQIQLFYSKGHATKEDYTTALQSYQTYLGEIKSKQRDDAAAADNRYRYY